MARHWQDGWSVLNPGCYAQSVDAHMRVHSNLCMGIKEGRTRLVKRSRGGAWGVGGLTLSVNDGAGSPENMGSAVGARALALLMVFCTAVRSPHSLPAACSSALDVRPCAMLRRRIAGDRTTSADDFTRRRPARDLPLPPCVRRLMRAPSSAEGSIPALPRARLEAIGSENFMRSSCEVAERCARSTSARTEVSHWSISLRMRSTGSLFCALWSM